MKFLKTYFTFLIVVFCFRYSGVVAHAQTITPVNPVVPEYEASFQDFDAVVSDCSYVNLRETASSSSTIVGVLPEEYHVVVVAQSGHWFQVSTKSQIGYIHMNYVSFIEPPADNESNTIGISIVAAPASEEYNQKLAALCDKLKGIQFKYDETFSYLYDETMQEDPALQQVYLALSKAFADTDMVPSVRGTSLEYRNTVYDTLQINAYACDGTVIIMIDKVK